MSVEVLNAGEAGPPSSPVKNAASVRAIAGGLYNLLLSEPPASAAMPPPLVPTPSMLGRSSASTGCAMNGVTKTVIMFGGINGQRERMKAALERSKSVADIARKNGNQLHYVFIGGALPPHGAADERVAEWMLALKDGTNAQYGIDKNNVHLIAGPREMQALSVVANEDASTSPSATKRYLMASKLVECLGPQDMDERGTRGVWIKATSTQGGDIVGKLPGVGVVGANGSRAEWTNPQEQLSAIAWKNELNKIWAEVTADPCSLRDTKADNWHFWMILGIQSALDEELLPAQGLDTEGCKSIAIFGRHSAPFGTIRRTLRIDPRTLTIMSDACWMDIGVTRTGLFWGVQTWCFSTMRAINEHKLPVLDRTPSMAELQYDVSSTLSSLVQHSERLDALTPPTFPWCNFAALVGQLGPCVCGGRKGQEVLRVIIWKGDGMPDVVMLLPEAYLRVVLADYYKDMLYVQEMGARAVSGFLVLHDEDIVPMRLPGVSEAKQVYATDMGARLWRLSSHPRLLQDEALREMTAAPPAWREILQYCVDGVSSNGLTPGQRVDSTAGRHIFYTHTTSGDPLAGLFVRWVFAPPADARNMPTLDVANDAYEKILSDQYGSLVE